MSEEEKQFFQKHMVKTLRRVIRNWEKHYAIHPALGYCNGAEIFKSEIKDTVLTEYTMGIYVKNEVLAEGQVKKLREYAKEAEERLRRLDAECKAGKATTHG